MGRLAVILEYVKAISTKQASNRTNSWRKSNGASSGSLIENQQGPDSGGSKSVQFTGAQHGGMNFTSDLAFKTSGQPTFMDQAMTQVLSLVSPLSPRSEKPPEPSEKHPETSHAKSLNKPTVISIPPPATRSGPVSPATEPNSGLKPILVTPERKAQAGEGHGALAIPQTELREITLSPDTLRT